MNYLTKLNARLVRLTIAWAVFCLTCIVIMVVYGVVMRYAFDNAPPFVEQLALLLVINVAFFGAAAVVRDEGHIGMESLVILLPKSVQYWIGHLVGVITLIFAVVLVYGGLTMAESVYASQIPILGVSEAWRYFPSIIGGVLIFLFAIEHIFASFFGKTMEH